MNRIALQLAIATALAAGAPIAIAKKAAMCSQADRLYSCSYRLGKANKAKKVQQRQSIPQMHAACHCPPVGSNEQTLMHNNCVEGLRHGSNGAPPQRKLCA